MAEIYDNDTSAANNNAVPPAGWPENMQYSQVNNTGREQMAVLARYIEANGALTTTGTDPAYILTITQALSALANGMIFAFKADKTNAVTAPTLQINALAAAALVDGEGNALPIGAIVSGRIYAVQFDGVSFQVMNSSTQFTAAERAKLAGIEAGATADQTGAEIKSLYEAEADTNAFDDAAVTKLAGIEAGATAEVAATEGTAGIAEIATQAEVDAGSDDTRIVTPAKLAATPGNGGVLVTEEFLTPSDASSTTTLAALFACVAIASGENYIAEMFINGFSSNLGQAPTLRIRLDSTVLLNNDAGMIVGYDGAPVGDLVNPDANHDIDMPGTSANSGCRVKFEWAFTASANGTLEGQFAAGAGYISGSVTVVAGSWFRLWRVT